MRITRLTAASAAGLLAVTALSACTGGSSGDDATMRITANGVRGGKGAPGVDWIESWVIPKFQKHMKDKGKDISIKYEGSGVEDGEYKTKIALELKTGRAADVVAMDGIWVGEFAQAGHIQPLEKVMPDVEQWPDWAQVPKPIQENMSFEGKKYGAPLGTDGRVIYFHKDVFAKAGLPADWQPKSWDEIYQAGEKLKKVSGITPIQLNAGTSMTEATTMQGVLPLLAGTGKPLYENGKWLGNTKNVRDVLSFYKRVYDAKQGDAKLQQQPSGRDDSFKKFADGKVGMLLEGDYFWREAINPKAALAPMDDRDSKVGFALIPSMNPATGLRGQDFVSMSGGTGFVINPKSKNAKTAAELLKFMGTKECVTAAAEYQAAGITPRKDVNAEVLKNDPLMNFIAQKVMDITAYRPGLAQYPQVSVALQKATTAIITGKSVDEAAKAYQTSLGKVVGDGNVLSD